MAKKYIPSKCNYFHNVLKLLSYLLYKNCAMLAKVQCLTLANCSTFRDVIKASVRSDFVVLVKKRQKSVPSLLCHFLLTNTFSALIRGILGVFGLSSVIICNLK